MTPEEIKTECEKQYAIIKEANIRLKGLRAVCKHENTFEGIYSWRVGCEDPATICSDCGSFIKINTVIASMLSATTPANEINSVSDSGEG